MPFATRGPGPLRCLVADVPCFRARDLTGVAHSTASPATPTPSPASSPPRAVRSAARAVELDALSVDGSRTLRLASAGATTIDAVSADEAWALYDRGDSPASDLWIASTTGAATPAQLAPNERAIGIFGDAFTTDSRFAVFMVDASEDSASNTHGALVAASVSSPTTLIPLASRSGITASFSPSNTALSARKLSFIESFDPLVGLAGSADIRVVDLAVTNASSLLVAGAEPMYAVSFAKTRVLYAVSRGGSSDGIYSVPAPH